MLLTNAVFHRKDTEVGATACVVDKVIKLSGVEFDRFSRNLMRDWDFIRDNPIDTVVDMEGRYHCLLVTGEGRRDGILVNSEGGDYARYSAFIPNVDSFLLAEQYPALSALNHRLTDIVDFIVAESSASQTNNRAVIDLQELETIFNIDLRQNNILYGVVTQMLEARPEIKDWELDKNELILHFESVNVQKTVEAISISAISQEDVCVEVRNFDGVTPINKKHALELYEKGCTIHLLHKDDSESVALSREEIKTFDGIIGAAEYTWNRQWHAAPIEVFVANREQFKTHGISGSWLKLPADAATLSELFGRVGVDETDKGKYCVTSICVPLECLRDYVTEFKSLDELNMLASYMYDMKAFELNKLQAILTSKVMDIGSGVAALINLLDSNNFDAFNLINVSDAESLGRYYAAVNDEMPEDITFVQYGYQCIKEESGVFTEHGYIYCRYGELSQEYTGVVPDEYKIVGTALQSLRSKQIEGSGNEKPSVVEKIRAARHAPRVPAKDKDAQKHKKSKEGQDL